MTGFVRVKLPNGSEASVSPQFAARHKLRPTGDIQPLAKPAKHDPLTKTASAPAPAVNAAKEN